MLTKQDRDNLICVIALLHSDYGYTEAQEKLHAMVGKMTPAELRRMEKIEKANSDKN